MNPRSNEASTEQQRTPLASALMSIESIMFLLQERRHDILRQMDNDTSPSGENLNRATELRDVVRSLHELSIIKSRHELI